jgi:hypothetical protein
LRLEIPLWATGLVARLIRGGWSLIMLNDRENILSALREKPLTAYEITKRANIPNEEACQSLLLKETMVWSTELDVPGATFRSLLRAMKPCCPACTTK